MEALYLDKCVFVELYFLVALLRWIEHVIVDVFCDGADTVDTAYTLHKTCGIPWWVVVDNDIGTVKVDAFSKNIGCDDDVIVVFVFSVVVGIEVFLNHQGWLLPIIRCHHKYVGAFHIVCESVVEIVQGVDAFWEDDEFSCGVYVFIKEIGF